MPGTYPGPRRGLKPPPGTQLDRSHPLARGLAASFVPQGATRFTDAIGNAWAPVNGPAAVGGRYGAAFAYDGATNYHANTTLVLPTSGCTVAVLFRPGPYNGHGSLFGATGDGSVGGNPSRLQAHLPDNVAICWDYGGSTAPNRLQWTPAPAWYDSWHAFVLRAGPSGSSIWSDGVLEVGQSTGISRSQAPSPGLSIGAWAGAAGNYNLATIECLYLASREWSDAEIVAWSAAPYAMFLSPAARRFFAPLAPPAPSAGFGTPLGPGLFGRAGSPASAAAPISSTDAGAGTESTALLAVVATADSGAGEGSATLLAGPSQSDTGAGEGSATLLAIVGSADTGTADDAGSVFAGLSLSDTDSGSGQEGAATLAPVPASADSGTGLDGSSLAATPAGADSGAGTDSGSILAGLSLSDSDPGTGTEGTPALLASSSSADAGAGADAASVAATPADGDPGHASESSALLAATASADSGTGTEGGSTEDVSGAVTIHLAAADAGAGTEATVALAAAPADEESAAGGDNAWVLAGAVDAPYRDRQLLRLLADALRATGEFDEVTTSGPPEDRGRTAADLRLACLELDGWQDADHWSDFGSIEQVRTVAYTLHLLVRADDPDLRDDEVDRLVAVAANVLNGIPLGDVSVPNKTRLLRGKWQPAAGPERRLAVAGQFVYTIPDFDRHTAAEDT